VAHHGDINPSRPYQGLGHSASLCAGRLSFSPACVLALALLWVLLCCSLCAWQACGWPAAVILALASLCILQCCGLCMQQAVVGLLVPSWLLVLL